MNKQEYRKLYRQKRSSLSDKDVERESKKIAEKLFVNIDFSLIHSVHIFLPIEHHKELNTWNIIRHIWNKFKSVQIVVPKVEGNELKTHILNPDTKLKKNELGIPEPENAPEFNNEMIDMVLMPLLVFDKDGNRIGYGKGFYDKFLSSCKKEVVKVGLTFFEAEESIPSEQFDIPLHFCVTPEKFYTFL